MLPRKFCCSEKGSVQQSLRRSWRKHAVALWVFYRTNLASKFKETSLQDCFGLRTKWKRLQSAYSIVSRHASKRLPYPEDVVNLSDKAHFHLTGTVNKQHSGTGLKTTPWNSINDHSPKLAVWCVVCCFKC